MEMKFELYFLIPLLLLHFTENAESSSLTVKPKRTEAVIGETVIFNCSSCRGSDGIQWFHYPKTNPERQIVYGFDQLFAAYKTFHIEMNNKTGALNLIIPSVTSTDAGKYECQDAYGRGDKSQAKLIVLTESSSLTVKPKRTEAVIGETVIFNCSSGRGSDGIQWFHYPKTNPERQIVYGFDQIFAAYKTFRIEMNNKTGALNLIIPSVTSTDAGKYECQDAYGRGDKSQAKLIVLTRRARIQASSHRPSRDKPHQPSANRRSLFKPGSLNRTSRDRRRRRKNPKKFIGEEAEMC